MDEARSLRLLVSFAEETAIWRARHYGDDRLLKKAYEIDTPSCDKINHIFGGG